MLVPLALTAGFSAIATDLASSAFDASIASRDAARSLGLAAIAFGSWHGASVSLEGVIHCLAVPRKARRSLMACETESSMGQAMRAGSKAAKQEW